MRTRAQATGPGALDVAFIAGAFEVPEATLEALLDAPTAELVNELLTSLNTKGQTFESLNAEKLKLEVELENTVRTSDAKVKAQKTAVARQAKEVEDLRIKLNEAEGSREALSTELDQLRSSSTGSTTKTQLLRQRVDTLEASNRDALALIENKSTEKDRIANELSEQHSKLLGLRKEISQLEERNQSLENAASSQKFKEQSLQQEIELLKRNNEWHSNELQTRNKEHAAFRKERNASIAHLQRELEDANASVDALKRTEAALRQRLDEVQVKADEAFTRIASLQDEAARKEQDFRTELNSSKRLAGLQAQSAATHKARLQEVQSQADALKDDAADEIGRLQAEIETERSDKKQAEDRLAELELEIEQRQQQSRASRPGTPMRNGGNGSRAGSPSALSGSLRKSVGGLSFTQLYSNYTAAQEMYEVERRRTNKLTDALDELVNEIEGRKPEIEELRGEQIRLEHELLDYSRLLDESNEGRDSAVAAADRWQGEAQSAAREGQILRQQLRDLSVQIKILLVEIQSRDQGLGELSADERFELERAARGDLTDDSLDEATTTGRLISERLVIFRDISSLQAQNEKLLRVTRDLGEQMEGNEAIEKARQSAADAQEVEELRQQVSRYKDELQATATQIDSYMKERDMFRRMLQHRGQLAPNTDMQSMFGQSVPPATPRRNGMEAPATPRSKDMEDLNKLLKEQQTFFDQYRNESSSDRRVLKEQVDALAQEKGTLQTDLARAESKLTLAGERYEMLQSNFQGLRTENGELQKRSQQLAENAAKQDLRTQQVAEELVEARSMADSLRSEKSNSKAEKELWKRIEGRLTEDNKGLMDERSRLNKMVADLQNLQNERDLADSEGRRRLQSRLETLESELTDTKKKLEVETGESKKASMRREYEENQSRTRIDDLVKSLGNVREELVAAKTARDQLQSRVDELKIELRSSVEKVTALQPRPTPRSDAQAQGNEQSNGAGGDLSAEQRLSIEVSDLRRDLELTRTELDNARQQVEQFRAIAQSTEEELANFNQTAEQYKEDVDRMLAEKDASINGLEQRIEDLSSELMTTANELSGLRIKAEDSDRLLSEQKATLESETTRLRDDAERYSEEKKLYQEDLKAQAEIAQQAQSSYEDELVRHAAAARSLQNVRKEHNELRTQIAGIKAESEGAKASLERGEESWAEQRERFERELEEVKRRRHDVDEQNKLLHQQMENFSSELASLRQNRASAAAQGEAGEGTPSGSGGESNLQEVIKFLRREKEIVDCQYELSVQEVKRLQQQYDYANTQLEETRQKLAEKRRQSTDKPNSEGSTTKLMQTINELNLFRESSTTLRNEARQAREKLEEKSKEVERLFAEFDPLKGRVGELEGDLETKDGEMKLLQSDRDHWRERTQNIISKYDRVDPAELEEMRKQLEELKAEKERLEAEQAPLKEQVDGFDERLESERATAAQNLSERLEKFKGQAKEQDRKRTERIRELTAEKDGLAAELEDTKMQLESKVSELETMQAALNEVRANTKDDDEEGQVHENAPTTHDHAASHAQIAAAEAHASEHASRADALDNEVQALQARVQELEGQVSDLGQQLETAAKATGSGQAQGESALNNTAALEKLQQELAAAQKEVETLRASAASNEPTVVNAQPAPGEQSISDQVAEQVDKLRSELEAQHELAKKQMEEARDRAIEKSKNNLNRQLKEERDKMRPDIEQELNGKHSEEIQKLRDEHHAAVEQLKQDYQAELEKLTQDGTAAIAKGDSDATKAQSNAPSEITEAQLKDILRNNQAAKTYFSLTLRTQVEKQIEKLHARIASKDAEIASLKEALEKAPTGENSDCDKVSRQELEQKLEGAKKDRIAALNQANENAEKKGKVQVSLRETAQAKLKVVQTAARETPEKPVKEVWELAEKAKPAPKTPMASTFAPSPTSAKPPVPASPTQAAPSPVAPVSGASAPGIPATTQADLDKLRARRERFGTGPPATQNVAAPTGGFGQPSALSPATGTFGRSSAPASAAPNPQAPAFNPNTAAPIIGTAPAAPRGPAQSGIPVPGSRLPTARPGSVSGGPGLQIQGAAVARGGGQQQSGLPRGGGNFNARGGGRGGPASAGQKRPLDGGEGGNDAKRTRGRGPSDGA